MQWDKKKKCRKYGKKQYRREFQEVDKRTKNCRQDVKLVRIPRSEGTGKGGILVPVLQHDSLQRWQRPQEGGSRVDSGLLTIISYPAADGSILFSLT